MKKLLLPLACFISLATQAQKKALDHTVYDQWQSLSERTISNDGKYVVYTINPQEGDGVLVVQSVAGNYKQEIARGYNAAITDDNRFVVCRIRPLFKDTRDAKIKKKLPDEMPKDSLAVIELGKMEVVMIPRVKSYKTPDKSEGS